VVFVGHGNILSDASGVDIRAVWAKGNPAHWSLEESKSGSFAAQEVTSTEGQFLYINRHNRWSRVADDS